MEAGLQTAIFLHGHGRLDEFFLLLYWMSGMSPMHFGDLGCSQEPFSILLERESFDLGLSQTSFLLTKLYVGLSQTSFGCSQTVVSHLVLLKRCMVLSKRGITLLLFKTQL